MKIQEKGCLDDVCSLKESRRAWLLWKTPQVLAVVDCRKLVAGHVAEGAWRDQATEGLVSLATGS